MKISLFKLVILVLGTEIFSPIKVIFLSNLDNMNTVSKSNQQAQIQVEDDRTGISIVTLKRASAYFRRHGGS